MTDCPSFITADQLVIIEPHERVFNGINSDYIEGTAHGDFVEDEFGLQNFPDQLRTFCVLENIDFSKPYPGTIFRFPLRTEDQAKTSRLSGNAYPADKVRRPLGYLHEPPKNSDFGQLHVILTDNSLRLLFNLLQGHGYARKVEGRGSKGYPIPQTH